MLFPPCQSSCVNCNSFWHALVTRLLNQLTDRPAKMATIEQNHVAPCLQYLLTMYTFDTVLYISGHIHTSLCLEHRFCHAYTAEQALAHQCRHMVIMQVVNVMMRRNEITDDVSVRIEALSHLVPEIQIYDAHCSAGILSAQQIFHFILIRDLHDIHRTTFWTKRLFTVAISHISSAYNLASTKSPSDPSAS